MKAPLGYPRLIQPARYARNGMVPDVALAQRCVDVQNHVNAYRKKTLLHWSDWVNVGAGSAGTNAAFRFRFHSGHDAKQLVVRLALGLDSTGTGTNPGAQVDVKISGGATTTTTTYHGLNNTAASDTPSNLGWRTIPTTISADTDYEVTISTVDYGRILSAGAWETGEDEVTSGNNYLANYQLATGAPIWDATRATQLQGPSKLWRHNASALVTWPGAYPGSAPTFATTTWTNVLDGTTAVASSSAGYHPTNDGDLTKWCRVSDGTTLDVVVWAYASCADTNGAIRFQDSTGTRCSLTGIGTAAGFYSTTTTIANVDTIAKLDLQAHAGVNTKTLTLYAAGLYCYLA